jgi:hypothetical protein
MILDINCCILNLAPSKPTLLEPTVLSVAIDHQVIMIQVQEGKNLIEDVLIDGGSGVNIITEKLKV